MAILRSVRRKIPLYIGGFPGGSTPPSRPAPSILMSNLLVEEFFGSSQILPLQKSSLTPTKLNRIISANKLEEETFFGYSQLVNSPIKVVTGIVSKPVPVILLGTYTPEEHIGFAYVIPIVKQTVIVSNPDPPFQERVLSSQPPFPFHAVMY